MILVQNDFGHAAAKILPAHPNSIPSIHPFIHPSLEGWMDGAFQSLHNWQVVQFLQHQRNHHAVIIVIIIVNGATFHQ